jgi:hypothetical protein
MKQFWFAPPDWRCIVNKKREIQMRVNCETTAWRSRHHCGCVMPSLLPRSMIPDNAIRLFLSESCFPLVWFSMARVIEPQQVV